MAAIGAGSGVRHAPRSVEVFVVDAAHFPNAPDVQRGWCRKGQQGKGPPPRQRQSATLFGALPRRTQHFDWKRAARGTSTRLLELLPQLHQCFPTARLILMLENATMHQSRAVRRLLTQHDWVVLAHVAPYSPAYNPMERFWQWLKAKVYGATAFATIDDVSPKVRQLIWHDHEGWLTATIHFDFTDYQNIL